jgi:hypothetical protein
VGLLALPLIGLVERYRSGCRSDIPALS